MTRTFTVKIGKSPDEMGFDECMAHIKRVLFWDYIDGEWCDVVPLSDKRWEELAGYIIGAHEREIKKLKAESDRLRDERARYEDLAHILDREWNIYAEWDGLRKIWYVGLTELGARLRDEREAARFAYIDTISELEDQNAKLCELILDMVVDEARGHNDDSTYYEHVRLAKELGIEVHE